MSMREYESEGTRLNATGTIVGFSILQSTFYAMDSLGHVYRSRNYGDTWQRREVARSKKRFVTLANMKDEVGVWVDV